jgi:hypothetical protein
VQSSCFGFVRNIPGHARCSLYTEQAATIALAQCKPVEFVTESVKSKPNMILIRCITLVYAS